MQVLSSLLVYLLISPPVTFEYKLERLPREKKYFGRPQVHILFSTMLQDTESSGVQRETVIQTMCKVLLSFYASCRPSTLGYTDEKNLNRGLVSTAPHPHECALMISQVPQAQRPQDIQAR